MSIKFIYLLLPVFFFTCKTIYISPTDYKKDSLTVGFGGGFAGTYTDYCLLSNGQLFKKDTGSEKWEELPKMKKTQVKQLFDNYHFLNLESLAFEDPGNMSKYLHYRKKDIVIKQQWGGANKPVPKNLSIFYSSIMNQINQISTVDK